MGRPPTNGGPSFRFNPVEVGEMEAILHAYKCAVPGREILEALAQRFSSSAERAGKMEVSVKQVLNWFQNRRYALRAKAARSAVPGQVNVAPVPNQAVVNTVAQASQLQTAASDPASVRSVPQVPQSVPAPPVAQSAGRNASENSQMEFEAKSARDGAWYDIACFLSYRSLESGNPEALVRLAGFGEEEDEWVNIRRNVRQRSLPCESSECVAVLPGDLVLCFQEGKDQALYFDAHVLDAQRRRHDIRGCRCRFLVRYDQDQSEEIVPLRKICRRPETDYRLQQLYARSANANPQKTSTDTRAGTLPAAVSASSGTTQNKPVVEDRVATVPMIVATTQTNVAAGATSGPTTSVAAAATIGPMTTVAPAAATLGPMTTVAPAAATLGPMTTVGPAAATIGPMTNVAPAAATIGPMTTVAPVVATIGPMTTVAPVVATIGSMTDVAAAVPTGAVTDTASHTNIAAAVTAAPMTNVAAAGTTGATTQTTVSAASTSGLINDATTETNIVPTGPMNGATTETNVAAVAIIEPMNDATPQSNVIAAGTTGPMAAGGVHTNLAAAATTTTSTAQIDVVNATTEAQSMPLNRANNVDSDAGNAASAAPVDKNPSHTPAMVSSDVAGGSHPSPLQQG